MLLKIKGTIIFAIFIFGIAGSLGACEVGHITIPEMFSQIAFCAALIGLVASFERWCRLGYQMLQRLRKAAQSVPRDVRRVHSGSRSLKVH